MTKPVTYGHSKIVSTGKCQAHGDFYIEFRLKSCPDKSYCVVKTVRKITAREKNDMLVKISKWSKAKQLLTKKAKQKKTESEQ